MKNKTILPLTLSAFMALTSTTTCFAAGNVSTDGEGSTSVYLTVEATPIDVTVTDSITLSGSNSVEDMTITPMEVTNNSTMGVIQIDSMEVVCEEGWSLVSNDTVFSKLESNTKSFSLVVDLEDDYDFSNGAYTQAGTIDPTASTTINLAGKLGMHTTSINAKKIATITTTVSYK